MTTITLEPVNPKDRDILFRMLQYSLFEESLSDFNEMNNQALFEYPWFDLYFTEADRDAYFIKEEGTGNLLGFVMVNTHSKKQTADHSIAEFMVIPKYRRRGIGKRAATACFDKYKGSWEVSPVMGSHAAMEFWKHVIDGYTGTDNKAEDGIFCFTCGKKDNQDSQPLSQNGQPSNYTPGQYVCRPEEDSGISHQNMVNEAEIPYRISAGERQGEYTLKDYYALPDDCRAELIDGVIYNMAAPSFVHQRLSGEVFFQITSYIREKKGGCIPMAAPTDVRLDCDDRTMVQPDVLILCDPGKIRSWGIDGAPDFVLEIISPSTGRNDYIRKLQKYADAGVREYWILDPEKRLLLTYYFQKDEFFHIRQLTGNAGIGIYGKELQIDLDELARIIDSASHGPQTDDPET